MDFHTLRKNLKKDFSSLTKVRVALLGDTSTQFLNEALRATGYDKGLNVEIWEADYNRIDNEVFSTDSTLYAFNPDVVIIFKATHQLLNAFSKRTPEARKQMASDEKAHLLAIHKAVTDRCSAKVILYNFYELDDAVFGSFANKTEESFLYQVRQLNFTLMQAAAGIPSLFICDMASIHNSAGQAAFFQPSLYINADMVLSVDILPAVAARTTALIGAMYGKLFKCIVLDLDNTLWGGIIGEDGLAHIQTGHLGIGKAFTQFQLWLKMLKERGIILTVCSKNELATAREPFEKHPDMVLTLDDFAVFTANWNNKAENIKNIATSLNIGTDAMVFIDDNPFERELVRKLIPDICVPELPSDPADYLVYLRSLNLFETVSFTGEDTARTELYKAEAQRTALKDVAMSEDDFLNSLNMTALTESFNAFNIPRVAQLSQRSNQFNLRTVRYTEDDLKRIANEPDYATFAFTLKDNFGDNGLIGVVVLKKEDDATLFIESWFMSCRVLKRTMENFTLNTIAAYAKENGYTTLKGAYIPTPKNQIVKEHYSSLGFTEQDDFWLLNVSTFEPLKTFISPYKTD